MTVLALIQFEFSSSSRTFYPELADEAKFYLLHSLAERTLDVYISKFRIFLNFFRNHAKCQSSPFAENTLMLFATHRAHKVRAVTIRADFSEFSQQSLPFYK